MILLSKKQSISWWVTTPTHSRQNSESIFGIASEFSSKGKGDIGLEFSFSNAGAGISAPFASMFRP